MVAPASIHPAFDKACHLLGIKLRKAPLAQDFRAGPGQMERLINANTILLAASSPSYPHGLLDPIESIAEIARRRRLPLHVDACIGGFMLPWVEQSGHSLPAWDFRVNGVTSMSADLHKFGYAAKGASLVLYREPEYLKYQFYVATDWPGGIYASTTLLGTRPGGAVSAAWAALMSLGQEGYLRVAGEIMEGVQRLKTALADIEDLEIIGDPVMNIVAFTTRHNQPDIFVVADQLEARGWVVDRQQSPNCLHLTLMRYNIPVLDQYVADLKEALLFARNNPRAVSTGNAAMYGLMARIPFRGVVEKNVRRLFEELYNFSSSVLVSDHSHASTQDHSSLNPAPWIGKLNRFLTRWFAFKTWLRGKKVKE
ncbi:MAG: aspartate aminotransferase family protein [Haliscomenobacter sp.]|nr:aspartate aminotransferase family protein [Haliscomenobacter sp.]